MTTIAYFDLIAGIFIGLSIASIFSNSLRTKLKIRDSGKRYWGHMNLLVGILLLAFGILPSLLYGREINVYLIYFSLYMFLVWRISRSD